MTLFSEFLEISIVDMFTFSQLKGTCESTFEDPTTMSQCPRNDDLLPKFGLCDMSPVQINLVELVRLVVMAA